MVLWPKFYDTSDVDSEKKEIPEVAPNPEAQGDLAAAQTVTRLILKHNGIWVNALKPSFSDWESGKWLANDPVLPWWEPGTVTISLPDLKEVFRVFPEFKGE